MEMNVEKRTGWTASLLPTLIFEGNHPLRFILITSEVTSLIIVDEKFPKWDFHSQACDAKKILPGCQWKVKVHLMIPQISI